MKIHPIIAKALVAAFFSLQVWILTEVIKLEIHVARIEQSIGISVAERNQQ